MCHVAGHGTLQGLYYLICIWDRVDLLLDVSNECLLRYLSVYMYHRPKAPSANLGPLTLSTYPDHLVRTRPT